MATLRNGGPSPLQQLNKHQSSTVRPACRHARGEFLASPRVAAFLHHKSISGVSQACLQISNHAIQFRQPQRSSERRRSLPDLLVHKEYPGTLPSDASLCNVPLSPAVPYVWLTIQGDCAGLRHTHLHLQPGVHPSKKLINVKNVKRYINVAFYRQRGLNRR